MSGFRRPKAPAAAVASPRDRRVAGLLLGAAAGLAFGIVSQAVNPLNLPSVPLHQPPLGAAGNAAALAICGALIGLASAWSAQHIQGLVAGCITGVALLELRAWAIARAQLLWPLNEDTTASLLALTVLSALIVALLFIPVVLLLRWAVAVQGERQWESPWAWPRARAVLAIVIVPALLGTGAMYPAEVQDGLVKAHSSLQRGLAAPSRPDWLPGPEAGSYTLEWDAQAGLPKADLATLLGLPDAPYVVARFENGYTLICADGECTPAVLGP